MTVAAGRADMWHAWASPAEFAAKNAVLDQLCRDFGRNPRDVARISGAAVAVQASPGDGPAAGEPDVYGSPEYVLSQLRAYADAGADEFIISDDARIPGQRALGQIDILTRAVLPGLTF